MAEKEQPVVEVAPAPRSGILSKLIILAVLLVVVATECLLALLYLPTGQVAAEASAHASAEPAAKGGHDKPAAKAKEAKKEGKEGKEAKPEHGTAAHSGGDAGHEVEVDLGEFSVQAYQPGSNTTRIIEFHLYGTANDAGEFERAMEGSTNRIRDQIIVTLRSAEGTDLADPGLGLIKRQILAKTNATLGKPVLQSIIFSNFSFIEQ